MYAGGKKRLGEEGRWETFEQRLRGSEAVSVARKGNNRCRGPEASGFVGKSWGGGSRARGGGVRRCLRDRL